MTEAPPRSNGRRLKPWFFVLEGVNSAAVVYFLNYLFFLLRDEYGFGNKENLTVCAIHGLTYALASWQSGRLAQRIGYFTALKLGFMVMLVSLALASVSPTIHWQVLLLCGWTAGMCLIWPSLEALVTEGEDQRGVARMVGIYNLTWSGMAAVAFFVGGAVFDNLGPRSIYWVPAALHIFQILLLRWVEKHPEAAPFAEAHRPAPTPEHAPEAVAAKQPVKPQAFLWMGWFANPFAFIGISTVLAVVPQLAERFGLTPTQSGLAFSLWMFVRIATFAGLGGWNGWHYRFRWLLAAFVSLIVGFMGIVLAPQLWLALASQVFFGAALGLLYYSSLFYSMDLGDTRGEHGGLHEAALGVGVFVGPSIGAAALHLAPGWPNAGMWTVSALLLSGLAGLGVLRWKGRR